MKTFFVITLLITFLNIAQADDCRESFKGTTETLNSYTETVSKCLNRYSEDGPIAGAYDNLVDRFSAICIQTCEAQRARLCERMRLAKDKLKAASPYECTR